MTASDSGLLEHGNAYNIFILVLTLFSLLVMVLLVLPLDEDTLQLLRVYDNVICLIFVGDFAYNLVGSRSRTAYFIRARGWLDLLGSIPSLGLFPASGLLRLARLSRFARITRLLRGSNRKALVRDVVRNRGQYATFITILAAGMVLTIASLLVLQFESQDPDANIHNGGDALWWALVTITTVGYGDRFPVTLPGRVTGFAVMLAGVGIIGALASILASVLVAPSSEPGEDEAQEDGAEGQAAAPGPGSADAVAGEIARLREEIAALRAALPRAPD